MDLEWDHVSGEHCERDDPGCALCDRERDDPGCALCDREREELAGRRIIALLVMLAITAAVFTLLVVAL